jgi:hypothetical protein
MEKMKTSFSFLVGELKRRNSLKDLGVDERVI